MAEMIKRHSSTRLLWSGENFTQISKIFIPMNKSGNHWTLLVLDRKQKTRYYFDPMNGLVHTILSTSVPKSKLIELIDDISAVADLKTGWNCKSWLCVEPLHYTQTDSYNCGVIVCLFARCLCEGLDINGSYDVDMERERITSVIFGSCYDDLDWRNTTVCKICKDDDGEDWLGCDSCGQFFHASCLDVPFAETLTQHFTCP
ncbi:uncharacterized protein [Pocillopora verrucosa]